jgi:cytochrome P450
MRIPPGPAEKFATDHDLLRFLEANFAAYGDIYKASIYGGDVYVVSSPAYAEHVLLKNWQNYLRKGQAVKRIALTLGNGLISSNGEFWANQRRMIQPAFNRGAVSAHAETMTQPTIALRDKWKMAAQRRESVNVTRDVSLTVLEITLTALFGDDYAEVAPHFVIVTEESRNLEFAQSFSALGKIVIQVAARRREQGATGSDTLGMLMEARDRDGRPMADAQLAREILTLIVAGHETTTSVLNWTWYLLARHPAMEARLSAELESLGKGDLPPTDSFPDFPYARQVIDEALRLYPSLWLMTRKAIEDDYLGDYFVPAGTEIYISPYLIQRHPGLWQEPGDFDPDRFAPALADARPRLATCPFGAGPRNCMGESFARVEMQIHLMVIARELRLRLEDPEPKDFVAGMNLVSSSDFIMFPEFKAPVGGPR